jgi:hypothetical protein
MNFVFFGLIVLHNPIYIYYLMSNGGLGGIGISFTLRIIYFFSIILYFFYYFTKNNKILLPKSRYLLIGLFIVVVLVNSLQGVVRFNSLEYFVMDFIPIFEFILFYFIATISFTKYRVYSAQKIINYLFIYIGIVALMNVLLYVYASKNILSDFGALKALVGGVTVNRLMDFIIPLFFPLTLIVSFHGKKKYLHFLLIALLSVLIVLTFFRTIYLAAIVGVFVILFFNGFLKSKIISKLVKVGIIAFPLILIFNSIFSNLFDLGLDINFGGIFYERISSIFVFSDTSTTFSKYSRLDQYNDLDKIFSFFPLGHGMGAFLGNDPVSVMSNYFVSLFILVGFPGGLIFMILIIKAFFNYYSINKQSKNQRGITIFSSAALSILSMIIIIFIFFPYVKYFPIMMILGFILGFSNVIGKRVFFY